MALSGSAAPLLRSRADAALIALAFAGAANAAHAAPLDGVPATGAEPAAFAPAGWQVEVAAHGDLDGDAREDAVAVLLEAAGPETRRRALVWLKGAADGFERVATNVGLLPCLGCLGMKGGDATPELEIAKRVLVISQFGGSRFSYGTVHRLRQEKDGRVCLIGRDRTDDDTLTGASTAVSENLLTGVRVTEKQGPELDDAGHPTGAKPVRTQQKLPRKALPTLESLADDAAARTP